MQNKLPETIWVLCATICENAMFWATDGCEVVTLSVKSKVSDLGFPHDREVKEFMIPIIMGKNSVPIPPQFPRYHAQIYFDPMCIELLKMCYPEKDVEIFKSLRIRLANPVM